MTSWEENSSKLNNRPGTIIRYPRVLYHSHDCLKIRSNETSKVKNLTTIQGLIDAE